jgi:alkylhydroperoxidase family enzyme
MAHHPRLLRRYLRVRAAPSRAGTASTARSRRSHSCAAARTDRLQLCLDFGYWESTRRGVEPVQAPRRPRGGADSDVYTDLERRVLEYAEAMCADPVAVTDDMVEALRRDLDEAQLVELTMLRRRRERPVALQRGARPDEPGLRDRVRSARTTA